MSARNIVTLVSDVQSELKDSEQSITEIIYESGIKFLKKAKKAVAIGLVASVAACATAGWKLNYPSNAPPIRSDYLSSTNVHLRTRSGGLHNGIDIGYHGDMVIAMADGYVRRSSYNNFNGHGITLDHGKDVDGKYTLTIYIHLEKRLVEKCEENVETDDVEKCPIIKRGTPIGIVGGTGRAVTTEPHLHIAVFKNDTRAPRTWTEENPHKYWLNDPFNVTCYNPKKDYSNITGPKLTLPLHCK